MAVRLVEDLGSPAAVAVVNIVTKEVAPDWNEWAHYLLTAGGYLGGFLRFGGDFVKNLGIASLSGSTGHIYDRVRGGVTKKTMPVHFRPASRPAAPLGPVQRQYEPEFKSTGASAF